MKNEELNLAELLKDCPEGTLLYTPLIGEVEFDKIRYNTIYIKHDGIGWCFTSKGHYLNMKDAECLLFPSKDQRDWNVWKEEHDKKKENLFKVGDHAIDKDNDFDIVVITKITDSDSVMVKLIDSEFDSYSQDLSNLTKIDKYPINRFQPFDEVLCRHSDKDKWKAHFFSHINTNDREYPFSATFDYRYCIPYNAETKHLVGTTEEAPEFYINWEE
jgi:hypothetical protein